VDYLKQLTETEEVNMVVNMVRTLSLDIHLMEEFPPRAGPYLILGVDEDKRLACDVGYAVPENDHVRWGSFIKFLPEEKRKYWAEIPTEKDILDVFRINITGNVSMPTQVLDVSPVPPVCAWVPTKGRRRWSCVLDCWVEESSLHCYSGHPGLYCVTDRVMKIEAAIKETVRKVREICNNSFKPMFEAPTTGKKLLWKRPWLTEEPKPPVRIEPTVAGRIYDDIWPQVTPPERVETTIRVACERCHKPVYLHLAGEHPRIFKGECQFCGQPVQSRLSLHFGEVEEHPTMGDVEQGD
jgi:hypothetical protein